MTAIWNPAGILRCQPWSVRVDGLPPVASAQLAIAAPDSAATVPLLAVAGVVSGEAQQTVQFDLAGADTADLPPGPALADIWIWPADGAGRYPLFPTARLPILDPVAQLVGYLGHPVPPPTAGGVYPALTRFPAADLYPSAR